MRFRRHATAPPLPHAAQQASMYPSRGRRTTKWSARMVCRACPGLIRMVAGRLQCHKGTSGRFAPARRPDRSRGNPGATWVVTPLWRGRLRSRAPSVTPSRIGSRAPGSSDGVCLMAVTRSSSGGAELQPLRLRESGAKLQDPQVGYEVSGGAELQPSYPLRMRSRAPGSSGKVWYA